jgi:hypothetical protein
MSTFEEIRPEFEISSKVKVADIGDLRGVYPLHHSGVVGGATLLDECGPRAGSTLASNRVPSWRVALLPRAEELVNLSNQEIKILVET